MGREHRNDSSVLHSREDSTNVSKEEVSEGCGHLDIRIARDGAWFYKGSPIGRLQIVKLFSKVLRREEDGLFYLVTPVERGLIDVDDAPFVAVEMYRDSEAADQILRFRTNIGDEVIADKDHPIRVTIDKITGEPSPYVLVRDNLEALITRSIFYELVNISVEHTDNSDIVGVWSRGIFFSLGSVGKICDNE